MLNKAHKFGLSGVAVAVMLSIGSTAAQAEDGADEENAIEEMVVTATRLKGSATAVLQERKQQAPFFDRGLIMSAIVYHSAATHSCVNSLRF